MAVTAAYRTNLFIGANININYIEYRLAKRMTIRDSYRPPGPAGQPATIGDAYSTGVRYCAEAYPSTPLSVLISHH